MLKPLDGHIIFLLVMRMSKATPRCRECTCIYSNMQLLPCVPWGGGGGGGGVQPCPGVCVQTWVLFQLQGSEKSENNLLGRSFHFRDEKYFI